MSTRQIVHTSICRCRGCARRKARPPSPEPKYRMVEREIVLPSGRRVRVPVKLYPPSHRAEPLPTAAPRSPMRLLEPQAAWRG